MVWCFFREECIIGFKYSEFCDRFKGGGCIKDFEMIFKRLRGRVVFLYFYLFVCSFIDLFRVLCSFGCRCFRIDVLCF